jgi:hypothetical protein
MGTDDTKETGREVDDTATEVDEALPGDEQRPTEGSTWAAEEARQDGAMTIGDRADAELPEGTDLG